MFKFLPSVRGQYRSDYDLSKNTWFGVGGKAEILYKPSDVKDLSYFLRNKDKTVKVYVLGACSNVIIRDNYVDGVVIKLGREFTNIKVSDDLLEVGCAALDYNVANFLLGHGLSGLEFLIGIPGSIGGAIAMNSGCYGQEIADCLLSVEAVNIHNGKVELLQKSQLGLEYRGNKISKDYIFTHASFILKKSQQDFIKDKMDSISRQRENTQPTKVKTGGSTFKNPKNSKYSAWQLIEKSGLRGYRVGDAQLSEKHCNFILNLGNATAHDLESLGEIVIDKVYKETGIMLEWEIKRIGR